MRSRRPSPRVLASALLATLLGLVLAGPGVAAAPAALADELPRLDRDNRDYDQKHIRLDLDFDFEAQTVTGTCAITFAPLADDFRTLRLHCEDTEVRDARVRLAGEKTARPVRSWRIPGLGRKGVQPDVLVIDLGRTFAEGDEVLIEIDYQATPTNGLWWFKPTEERPEIPVQVWSQGEGTNNHHWFPCYDEPDDRITSELIATVPAGFEVISNGRIASQKKSDDGLRQTWHWTMEERHVVYLVSVIAGEFDHVEEMWEDIPLHYFTPPGTKHMVETTFGRTDEMMTFFSEYTGLRYPYPRYSQTTVWQFMHGGMENTTATTLNLRALHDERAHIDYSADGLIAHELVHQWFGDLITCLDWDELWLNEGFATYFTDLWFEHADGPDELLMRRRRSGDGWVRGSTPKKRATMRENRAKEAARRDVDMANVPLELPAGNNYGKGASVLHILRAVMGDDAFREGIRLYVKRRADTVATSEQLRAALEEVHGSSLKTYFDEWVYGAGAPDLDVSWSWDDGASELVLTVKQTQDETAGLFHFPVVLAVHQDGPQGLTTQRRTVMIDQPEQTLRFALDARPLFVRFDEGDTIPKRIRFPKELAELEVQVIRDPDVTGRLDAVDALGARREEGVPALARALAEDPEKGVRSAAARRLGALPANDRAGKALLDALRDDAPQVRRAAASGLGRYPAELIVEPLVAALEDDPSYDVQSAAARALGQAKAKGATPKLLAALDRGSHRFRVEVAAMGALADIGDRAVLPQVLASARKIRGALGRSSNQGQAIRAVARLGGDDERVRDYLLDMAKHPSWRTRAVAINSLGRASGIDTIPMLVEWAATEENDRVKRTIAQTIADIAKKATAKMAGGDGENGEKPLTELAAEAEEKRRQAERKSTEARIAEMEAERLKLEVEIRRLREQLGKESEQPAAESPAGSPR